jgi:mannose-1-phosphate guanylyltransferase / mannose-6-phosphate isomerase
MLIPVILSGGSGTRLWPRSRELFPKQLLPLIGKHTMLQETVRRVTGLEVGKPIVVCNEAHRFLAAEQLREIGCEPLSIILEGAGRNTAPAIAYAAQCALEAGIEDALLLVLPADHVIGDLNAFHQAVREAVTVAKGGSLVTFGIVPTAPETGYGYIHRGAAQGGAFTIDEFIEKPKAERAQYFLNAGDYYWNSGMFLFKASEYLKELNAYAPDIAQSAQAAYASAQKSPDFTKVSPDACLAVRSESIDYAVMEKTRAAMVLPLDAAWSDVGSWASLHQASVSDEEGNTKIGDVLTEDTEGCYLFSENRLVATVGLRDCVVIETKDVVLVAPKERAHDVKKLVDQIKQSGRSEHKAHREVRRPWGSYDSLETGDRFQVKRLSVRPGAELSLQLHHHRAEHWIVVSGTALITLGEKSFLLRENESTYIPLGVVHRVQNPGKVELQIIEVQSGSYLGEDDIVRFEDRYGRVAAAG